MVTDGHPLLYCTLFVCSALSLMKMFCRVGLLSCAIKKTNHVLLYIYPVKRGGTTGVNWLFLAAAELLNGVFLLSDEISSCCTKAPWNVDLLHKQDRSHLIVSYLSNINYY